MPSYGTPSFSSPISRENRVDILVDRTDDIANVRALQLLARSCPTVLTVAIPPGVVMPPGTGLGAAEIVWALGKRQSTRWKDPSPSQGDADVWLKANQIRELVILQAQHLPANAPDQLRPWAKMRALDLALLYCGAGPQVQPTITIEAFLDRPRRPPLADKPPPAWPRIEQVDLLDYRTQCFCQLSDAEYRRVDRAFHGSATRIRWFFDGWGRASRDELARAVAFASATENDQLRDILMNGALAGLLTLGRALPDRPPSWPPLEPHAVSQEQLTEFLEDINPWRAAIRFLRHWTHLSDHQLSVIGAEQITATTVAGIEIPHEMRPIFRAVIPSGTVDRPWEPFSGGVWVSTQRWIDPETDPQIDDADEPRSEATYADRPELVARILSGGLTRAHWAISRKNIPPAIRADVKDLRERGILNGLYPNEYELTKKAIDDSTAASSTHLGVGASPEEILLFVLKHRNQYQPPKYRDATTSEQRRHSQLVRLLADLVAFGHTNPQATGYLRAALERLRQLGYIDNFGPIAYRLSDRGVYSLCWDERLPARVEHPRDYYPPPRKKAL
jgi:hypothetical protein